MRRIRPLPSCERVRRRRLFALALIWFVALATYSAADPVWFFNTGPHAAIPTNFAGRVGAFIAELSYQLLGYASYLIPLVFAVAGWHYFWCHVVDAAYTKLIGAALLFSLRLVVPVARVPHPRNLRQVLPCRRLSGRRARLAPQRRT